MKAKLIKIRDKADDIISNAPVYNIYDAQKAREIATMVNELLAMMDSPELVAAKMNRELSKNKPINQAMLGLSYIPVAQAAINSIMGE